MADQPQLPPGLKYDGPLVVERTGNNEYEWNAYDKVKEYTNAFVIFHDKRVWSLVSSVRHQTLTFHPRKYS